MMSMRVSEAIRKRKSVRAYLGKEVSADQVAKVVEAGRWGPNAGPFQMSVIRNPKLLKKINDRTYEAMATSGVEFLEERASLPGYQPLYGAPVFIVLSAPADAPYGTFNVGVAAQNMLLQATELGLGSCFLVSPNLVLGGDENRSLAKEAGIPEGYVYKCGVIIGHAAAKNKFSVAERAEKGTVEYVD